MTDLIDTKKLRISQKSSEILSNVIRIAMREGYGFLWQNFEDHRKVWPVQINNVDVDTRTIIMDVDFDGSSPVPKEVCYKLDEIDLSKGLYFKGDEKEILFKAEEGSFFINNSQIIVPVPSIAYFKESRSNPRFTPIEPLSLGVKKFIHGHGHTDLNLNCRNLSKGGIGFTLSYANAHMFKKNEKVFIERIGDFELPKSLEGSISYIRKFHEERENKILMGLSFKKELSEKMYSDVSSFFQ